MKIGPVQNNEVHGKVICDSPKRQKGIAENSQAGDKRDPTLARAELGDLADRTLTGAADGRSDSYAPGTVNAIETAAEEAQLYDRLADSLAAARSGKGLMDRAASSDGRISRLEMVRQRIAEGYYDSRTVKDVIAQKLADEFEGSKPQQDEIEDDS